MLQKLNKIFNEAYFAMLAADELQPAVYARFNFYVDRMLEKVVLFTVIDNRILTMSTYDRCSNADRIKYLHMDGFSVKI